MKENLNIARRVDSEVTVKVPAPKATILRFFRECQLVKSQRRGGHDIYRGSTGNVALVLGEDWYYRICNANGDFAFVVEETLQFWLEERRVLTEFTKQSDQTFVHRGFMINIRFVKDLGNRYSSNFNLLK